MGAWGYGVGEEGRTDFGHAGGALSGFLAREGSEAVVFGFAVAVGGMVEGCEVLASGATVKQTRIEERCIGAQGAYRRLLTGSLCETCCKCVFE